MLYGPNLGSEEKGGGLFSLVLSSYSILLSSGAL